MNRIVVGMFVFASGAALACAGRVVSGESPGDNADELGRSSADDAGEKGGYDAGAGKGGYDSGPGEGEHDCGSGKGGVDAGPGKGGEDSGPGKGGGVDAGPTSCEPIPVPPAICGDKLALSEEFGPKCTAGLSFPADPCAKGATLDCCVPAPPPSTCTPIPIPAGQCKDKLLLSEEFGPKCTAGLGFPAHPCAKGATLDCCVPAPPPTLCSPIPIPASECTDKLLLTEEFGPKCTAGLSFPADPCAKGATLDCCVPAPPPSTCTPIPIPKGQCTDKMLLGDEYGPKCTAGLSFPADLCAKGATLDCCVLDAPPPPPAK